MVILICGDRNWSKILPIKRELAASAAGVRPSNVEVVDGAARGADDLGNVAAKQLGFCTVRFAADWETQHRAAGVIRNQKMLQYLLTMRAQGREVRVLAFHENLAESKGTKDMVTRARKAGVRVEVVTS